MPAWANTQLETRTARKIQRKLERDESRDILSAYYNARKNVVEVVMGQITRLQPDLTDHGVEHVRDVMKKTNDLLGDDIKELNWVESYVLCKAILFHDVGNYYGRIDHENNISEIYDHACGTTGNNTQEKSIISRIVRAHSGTSIDGSRDTLKHLDEEEPLHDMPVRTKELAAILRFADELSEGQYRTSSFALADGNYEDACRIYHEYANCVTVRVDKHNGRIVLVYNVDVRSNGKVFPRQQQEYIKKILPYIYSRVVKLDEERQYSKYYSQMLNPYERVEVTINFNLNGRYLIDNKIRLDLPDRVIVPGAHESNIEEYIPGFRDDFMPGAIIRNIGKTVRG